MPLLGMVSIHFPYPLLLHWLDTDGIVTFKAAGKAYIIYSHWENIAHHLGGTLSWDFI